MKKRVVRPLILALLRGKVNVRLFYRFVAKEIEVVKLFWGKFLPRLFFPLGLSCLVLWAAFLADRSWNLQTLLILAALLLLWLSGNHWIMLALVRSLEWRHFPPDSVPDVDVAVVLGGGTRSATPPRRQVEMNESGDRLRAAAQLYNEDKVKHLLVSGGEIPWLDTGAVEAENMTAALERFGIPRQDIWQECHARSTYENARLSKEILEEHGVGDERVLLVTSAMHMARSLTIFRRAGVHAIPFPADYLVTRARWQHMTNAGWRAQLIYFLPTAEDLHHTTEAVKEYLGLAMLWGAQIMGD